MTGPGRAYGDPIMRTTVGPLPSTVYWRRRALVLGAVVIACILLFVACSGGGDSGKDGKNAQGSKGSGAGTGSSSSPTIGATSFSTVPPGGGQSYPSPGAGQPTLGDDGGDGSATGGGANGGGANGGATGGADGSNNQVNQATGQTCTDVAMSIVPSPSATTVQVGTAIT